jgi:hypothetical protein
LKLKRIFDIKTIKVFKTLMVFIFIFVVIARSRATRQFTYYEIASSDKLGFAMTVVTIKEKPPKKRGFSYICILN